MKKTKLIWISIFVLILFVLYIYNRDMITGYRIKKIMESGEVIEKGFINDMGFNFSQNVIIVNTKINDREKKYNFIFDTGAKMTLISKELVNELDLNTIDLPHSFMEKTSGLNDSMAVVPTFSTLKQIELGNLPFVDMGVMLLDFSKMGQLNDFAKDGFIGHNLLNKGIWQINYRDTIITITDNIEKLKYINEAFKVNFTVKDVPHISVTINDSVYIDLIFDTGYNGGVKIISNKLLNGIDTTDRKEYQSLTASGKTNEHAYLFNAKSFRLGQKILNNTPIEVLAYKKSQQMKENSGKIGNAFLKNYIITLDYNNNVIYFCSL